MREDFVLGRRPRVGLRLHFGEDAPLLIEIERERERKRSDDELESAAAMDKGEGALGSGHVGEMEKHLERPTCDDSEIQGQQDLSREEGNRGSEEKNEDPPASRDDVLQDDREEEEEEEDSFDYTGLDGLDDSESDFDIDDYDSGEDKQQDGKEEEPLFHSGAPEMLARSMQPQGECSAPKDEESHLSRHEILQREKSRSLERLQGILQARIGWEDPSTRPDISQLIKAREARGHWSPSKRARISSRVLPNGEPEVVDVGNSRAYIGHFALNGDVFLAGFQNQTIRLYEVNQTHRPWKLRKEIVAKALNWTVTDTCLSPNQQLLVYSTISPVLHAVNMNATDEVQSIQNITDVHTPLDFGPGFSEGAFGLWAISFSRDGKYILAGSSDYAAYLFDIEAQRVVARARAHKDDVNSVCFADESDHVFLSGSDDTMIKVWDRRCGEDGVNRVQGMLPGHTEGIAHISPKGDGRYFISNGKDQKCKLWDIRTMCTSTSGQLKKDKIESFDWDYRWQPYPGNPEKVKHPHDRSIATFTGHKVLQTLIRCRWSPAETTGQRYIFSGSQCGSLFVYDILTQKKAAVFRFHRSVMRDCDWHPYHPMLASVGWDGSVVRWQKLPELEGQNHNQVSC